MKGFKNRHEYRSASGQAILTLGAFGTVAIALMCFSFIVIGLNIYAISVNQHRLHVVATAAAKAYNARRFWLGATRPGTDHNEAMARGQQVGGALAAELKLPPTLITFNSMSSGSQTIATEAQATVSTLGLPIQAINFLGTPITLPLVTVSARGRATNVGETPFASVVISMPIEPNQDGGNWAPPGTPEADQERFMHRKVAWIPAAALGDQPGGVGGSEMWDAATTLGPTVAGGTTYNIGFEARGNTTEGGRIGGVDKLLSQ